MKEEKEYKYQEKEDKYKDDNMEEWGLEDKEKN